ncbi:MAG TPA: hypothetical protein PKD64_08530 [Pirellulaceae bacterium]|nr:hypothetical protein [Pirellulaceae bacterium]HMO92232.1 hypothetical protein [Pirellulaceae bacterium]HMP70741.1 hypothetical protein [Pirellulaceae bacterium]
MTRFSLKDILFNRSKVEYLADLFCAVDADFPKRKFVTGVVKRLPELELKQRIVLIAEQLEAFLPTNFPQATATLVNALPPPLDDTKTDGDFGDFILAPLGLIVVRNGLSPKYFKRSMSTLREITKRFSMEDAMRSFIRIFPSETLEELKRWSTDANYHVRRLVSESTRPSLPWSGKIGLAAEVTLPLLTQLHADKTRYVTRSVANHLNDIAKTHPDLAVDVLSNWHSTGKQEPGELMWMTRHALRTLIKRGHQRSLHLLGYNLAPKIQVGTIRLEQSQLRFGDTLCFSIDLVASRNESLLIDYEIEFVKANGRRTAKVFKAAKLKLEKGESATVSKRHKLVANATTFKLYPGEHRLSVQINGQPTPSVNFMLRQ